LGARRDKAEVKSGKVYLVGAGPGDPGLITVKGVACLKEADVVIYDRLVDESILHEARHDAEKIYVGKASSQHTLEQEMINHLLVQKAREGKEAKALAENAIPFEVVPGVSSAVAVPAYAGIPVTHRGIASSVTIVTGHKASEGSEPNIAWDKICAVTGTLVILMGLGNLAHVVDQLIKNNKSPSTPVAVITHGTTGRQRCVIGTLEDIMAKVRSENLQPPSVVIVGDVVHLRKLLCWFDR
jgi:uroporphyrinogen III methyltransferase/synthase